MLGEVLLQADLDLAGEGLRLLPWLGGIGSAIWASAKLLQRWDERDARNVAELWDIVEAYRMRAEACERELARYRAQFGVLGPAGEEG